MSLPKLADRPLMNHNTPSARRNPANLVSNPFTAMGLTPATPQRDSEPRPVVGRRKSPDSPHQDG
jgi:hypothetical protein